MTHTDPDRTNQPPLAPSELLWQTVASVTADGSADRAERREQLLAWMAKEVDPADVPPIGPPAFQSRPERPAGSEGTRQERPLNEVVFLTVAETAAVMRVAKMTVYRLVHSGHLPAIRVGRSFRIPEQAVHDYLRESWVTAERTGPVA